MELDEEELKATKNRENKADEVMQKLKNGENPIYNGLRNRTRKEVTNDK